MSKKKTKKEKPYYMTTKTKSDFEKEKKQTDRKNAFKISTFQMGLGFLIFFISNYIKNFVFAQIFAIFGLGIMLYSIYNSYILDREAKVARKSNIFIDVGISIVIIIGIIYKVYLLFAMR